jgi:hypothetical protein
MTDRVVRTAFHQTILKNSNEDRFSFVLNEFGLKNGTNRADIAVLNGKLIGYEIKTEKDTLTRLPSQVNAYNEVFDSVFLITTNKHLHKVKKIIPDWWGIYQIHQNNVFELSFSCHRKGKINREKNTYGIAQLLWKEELSDFLFNKFGLQINPRVNKHQMYEFIAAKCTPTEFGKVALAYLKKRSGWRKDPKPSWLYDGCAQPIPKS